MARSGYSQQFWNSYNAHLSRRSRSISLVAGQNVFGADIAQVLGSDLGNRVVETYNNEQLFPGMEEYLQIEDLLIEILKTNLKCDEAEVRPLSGTSANFITYQSLLSQGDLIASASISNGAHVSWSARTIQQFGFEHSSLPYAPADCTIDLVGSLNLIHQRRPNLVILGGSVVLFPEPIAEISELVHKYDGVVLYDAAHVIGHILSGDFPNPLLSGCDLMTFTLCKTVAGPQHAIICGKNALMKKIHRTADYWHSGYHLHEVAASALSIIKHTENGRDYSAQMISNAKALANGLIEQGLTICTNKDGRVSETYMFLADVSRQGGGKQVEDLLLRAGILVGRNLLPGVQNEIPTKPSGLRFGVAEVTSLGMKEIHMERLAGIIGGVVRSGPESIYCEAVAEMAEAFSNGA
jgi:glycine hydroxymethyltransferase